MASAASLGDSNVSDFSTAIMRRLRSIDQNELLFPELFPELGNSGDRLTDRLKEIAAKIEKLDPIKILNRATQLQETFCVCKCEHDQPVSPSCRDLRKHTVKKQIAILPSLAEALNLLTKQLTKLAKYSNQLTIVLNPNDYPDQYFKNPEKFTDLRYELMRISRQVNVLFVNASVKISDCARDCKNKELVLCRDLLFHAREGVHIFRHAREGAPILHHFLYDWKRVDKPLKTLLELLEIEIEPEESLMVEEVYRSIYYLNNPEISDEVKQIEEREGISSSELINGKLDSP